MFDVTLPAHYSLNAAPIALRFAITGHQPIDVNFNVAGTVSLVASGSPNVATVLITGALQSVSNNPLQPAGLNCGQLSATFAANTVVGELNLLTGVYTPLPDIEVQLGSILRRRSRLSGAKWRGTSAEQRWGQVHHQGQ
ncbi:MAG: hypothetical protein IPK72_21735 [Candidatus Eisenbacteria bacterium]|nr:hypothetical protein [Candidatus Eisenbacteria bacterium]